MLYELEGFSIPNKIVQAVSGKCVLNIKYNREKNLRDNYSSSRPTNKNFDPLMEAFNEKNKGRFSISILNIKRLFHFNIFVF